MKHKQRIDFYKKSQKGYLLRILTLDDMSFWGANSLISIIFALFVVAEIEGASATHVGIAFMIREITIALLSVPIGKILDKQKGYIDELYFLSASGILVGIGYILLSFSSEMWQVYILMSFIGMTHALNLNSWRTLFYGSIKESERGETTGIYQSLMSVTVALIMALGGIMGDKYGFKITLLAGAGMSILGGLLPFTIRKAALFIEKNKE